MAVTPLCPKSDPVLTHHRVCHTLALGLKAAWEPWEGSGQGVPPSESLVWVPVCCCALCSSGIVEMDLWRAGGSWDRAGAGLLICGVKCLHDFQLVWGVGWRGREHHQYATLWKRGFVYMGRLTNSPKWLCFFKLQIKGSISFNWVQLLSSGFSVDLCESSQHSSP